jgi:hypothetical protein
MGAGAASGTLAAGVRVTTVSESQTAGRRVHDPEHPSADAEGYVTYSNVSAVEEMVNMISASRSYQNNVEVMNTTKQLLHEDAADGPVNRDLTALSLHQHLHHAPRAPPPPLRCDRPAPQGQATPGRRKWATGS